MSASHPITPPEVRRPLLRTVLVLLVALAWTTTLLVGPADIAAAAGTHSSTAKPKTAAVSSKRSVNLGMKFTTSTKGTVTALQFYRSKEQKRAYIASLWGPDGRLLAQVTFKKSSRTGWQTAKLSKPVTIQKGKTYTASYLASDGRFVATRGYYAKKRTTSGITVAKKGGVYTYSKKNKRPTTRTTSSYFLDIEFKPAASTPKPTTPTPTPTPTPTTPTTPQPPKALTAAEVAKASNARVFFAHKSVGRNILEGMEDLRTQFKVADPPRVDLNDSSLPASGPVLAETSAGDNGDPMGKIAAFKNYLNSKVGAKVDVAILKFCYSDVEATSGPGFRSIEALFTAYTTTMAELERAYPTVRFIYATVPVENLEIKGKRSPGLARHNANRARFNALLRAHTVKYGKPLLDVAKLESTAPDGTRYLTTYGGNSHEGLYEGYTRDGGHLNDRAGLGRKVVATELIRLIAQLS